MRYLTSLGWAEDRCSAKTVSTTYSESESPSSPTVDVMEMLSSSNPSVEPARPTSLALSSAGAANEGARFPAVLRSGKSSRGYPKVRLSKTPVSKKPRIQKPHPSKNTYPKTPVPHKVLDDLFVPLHHSITLLSYTNTLRAASISTAAAQAPESSELMSARRTTPCPAEGIYPPTGA